MHYLDELNPIQHDAVTQTDGPVLVIAGPGSGKTRVLTYRIAYLLEKGVAPWEILSLTFTNKAAREMKERIAHVVGDKAQHVWAGTFHSIFARILRIEAPKIGFPANFSVYDTDDSSSLIKAIIKEMSLDTTVYNANTVRSRISSAKSNLITPSAYEQNAELMAEDRAARRPHIQAIYAKYMARCQRAGAMDFDDLLLRLYELLRKNPEGVREKYQKKFRYLLVDEFQDTNFLQYAILKYLCDYPGSPRNVCVVGDDAQSIYSFRGATIDNILDFEKDYDDLRVFKLEQNYRSTRHIVAAANEVISFNAKQLKKTIWTDREEANKIKVLKCMTDDEESRRVADIILELKNRNHLNNSEIAILYRTNAQSRKFEEYLRRYNLPYRVFGGTSFYQRKEVKDLISYLRLVANPNDEEAFRRVINYPTRGIGDSTVDKISQLAGAENLTMWDTMMSVDVSERTRKSLAGFRHLVEEWHKRVAVDNAYQLAAEIGRRSGMLDALKADNSPEGVSRFENYNAVLDAIAEFMETGDPSGAAPDDKSLSAYLQTVTLLTDADNSGNGDNDHITLMSVHSAKGLEFKSVFVTGLEEKLFPSFMSLNDPKGVDEERRLFYVAITRAKTYLTISYAQNRYQHGQMRMNEPSRFISEIEPEHLEIATGSSMRGGSTLNSIAPNESPRASVTGAFNQPRRGALPVTRTPVNPDGFKASPTEAILPGVNVVHLKFGKGAVVNIDGPKDNLVATIQFEGDEIAERRIVLKFAKLQVV